MTTDWWDKVNLDPEVIAERSSEPPKETVMIFHVFTKASQPVELDRIIAGRNQLNALIAAHKEKYPTIPIYWHEVHEG